MDNREVNAIIAEMMGANERQCFAPRNANRECPYSDDDSITCDECEYDGPPDYCNRPDMLAGVEEAFCKATWDKWGPAEFTVFYGGPVIVSLRHVGTAINEGLFTGTGADITTAVCHAIAAAVQTEKGVTQ